MTVPSTFQIFETAERIELISADIYRVLAERFSDDAEARELFLSLEEEEIQHASRIRLMAVQYLHDSQLFGMPSHSSLCLDEVFEEGKRALRAISRGEWGTDLAAAKREVAGLEAKFAAAHAHILSRTANPALREFFERLASQDEAHGRLLLG